MFGGQIQVPGVHSFTISDKKSRFRRVFLLFKLFFSVKILKIFQIKITKTIEKAPPIAAFRFVFTEKDYDALSSVIYNLYVFFSIAKSLGARRPCEEAYNWTARHEILSLVIQDRDAVNACLEFAGRKISLSLYN